MNNKTIKKIKLKLKKRDYSVLGGRSQVQDWRKTLLE
jgi:hypothetical protein